MTELREDVRARNVIAILGAGVSVAATRGHETATWVGLIKSGAVRARAYEPTLPQVWEESVASDLALAVQGVTSGLWSAADKVTDALGGQDGGEFRAWLRADIGALRALDPEVIRAVHGLGVPIATTNYDELVERVTGRRATTWRDTAALQLALSGRSDDIAHLHGVWSDPRSVVFGGQSYAGLGSAAAAQALQQAMAGLRSLMFVGCGDGLDDPNFGALRAWLRATFGDSEIRHYRLCRRSELEQMSRQHADERITPVAYGDGHEDLPGFLERLRPADAVGVVAVRPPAQDRALEALRERARARIVLGDQMPDVETRSIGELLAPPVLLPMTQEQFSNSQDLDRAARPRRCDPVADAAAHRVLLVVADENAGLTSTLEWLVAEAHRTRPQIAPVVVDFLSLSGGHTPLARRITRELMASGATAMPRDPHPPLALAVDNVAVRPQAIFERMLAELAVAEHPFLVIGCRQGTEADVAARLNEAGLDLAVRYVGRMAMSDVVALATLVEPGRAASLAARAVEVADREHLTRTPMTLALLISVLIHGEALLGTASETALLDAYVSLLLGRGDPHDDARFSLDAVERADILGHLAENFATANAGSLPDGRVIEIFERYFDALGWDEDPIAVLSSFADRRLITIRGGQVRFTQASFLHLFAAKRAARSPLFLQALYERPLYFASIIRHYAALTRDDPEVLRNVEALLDKAAAYETRGPNFAAAAAPPPLSVDDGMFTGDPFEDDEEPPGGGAELEDWLDNFRQEDPAPFPVQPMEDAPLAAQVLTAVALVSNVLRDSELVDDLQLKERLLRKTLLVWGKTVDLLEEDDVYMQFLARLAARLAETLGVSRPKQEAFIDEFREMGAMMTAAGGISATLASRKLSRLLDGLFEQAAFRDDVRSAAMGALLGYSVRGTRWTEHFGTVRALHGDKRAVNVSLRRFAIAAYYATPLSEDEAAGLERFLVDQYLAGHPEKNHSESTRRRAALTQQLRDNRAIAAAQRKATAARTAATAATHTYKVIEGEVGRE